LKPKSAVDWQRSLKRFLILLPRHVSVEFLFVGVPIERPSILLGDQSVSITERHYPAWVRARQEKGEAQVRRTWQANEPQQEIRSGHKENDARYKIASIATSFHVFPRARAASTSEVCQNKYSKINRIVGGGGGSRTPVRKALRHEAYMLISIRCATRPSRADRAFTGRAQNEQETQPASPMVLARALRTERPRPAHCVTPLTGPMSEARGSVRLIN
jgi:hypothetical protein